MPKNILTTTILAVAIIAIGALVYLGINQASIQKQQNQENQGIEKEEVTPIANLPQSPNKPGEPKEPTPRPKEPTTTESIDTSDWKTYNSEELGLRLSYPTTWRVSEADWMGMKRLLILSNLKQDETTYAIDIRLIEKDFDLWWNENEELARRLGVQISKERISIGDKQGYRITGLTREGEQGESLALPRKDMFYLIEAPLKGRCKIGPCETLFVKIVDSFQFLSIR